MSGLDPDLERAIEHGIADESIFTPANRSVVEPTVVEPPPPTVRATMECYVIGRDTTRSELDKLARILSDAVPGRYEMDWLNGRLIMPDGRDAGIECVVTIVRPDSAQEPYLIVSGDVTVTRLGEH